MIKLTVGNSYSRVEGLSAPQERLIRKALSYKIDNYASGGNFKHPVRYLIDKHGEFPTGLLGEALSTLESSNWTIEDTRIVPNSNPVLFKLALPFKPYIEQMEAAVVAANRHRGTVSMPTGSGKAATIAILINRLQVKTLVVVPNLTLKRQLTQSFQEWFGETVKNITVENIDSANLSKLKDFDALICDESHHVAAKTYRDLNKKAWTGIYYRFFFTATPYRSRDEEQLLMESISGQVVYTLDYKTAVDKGMICPVEAFYMDLPKIPVRSNTWAAVYKECVTDRDDRNNTITEMMANLHVEGKSVLVLVKEIAHGEKLTLDGAFAFANGKDENTTTFISQFSRGARNVLVATTGVAGEGTDTKACEYVFIAGLGKSRNAIMQQIGRGLRRWPGKDSAKVILFRDRSHRFCLSHFRAQCKVLLDEFGIVPIKLEI